MLKSDSSYDVDAVNEQVEFLLANPAHLEDLCKNSKEFAVSPAAQNISLLSANNWRYSTYLSKHQHLWRKTPIVKDSDFLLQAPGHIIQNIINGNSNFETMSALPSKCWSKPVYNDDLWLSCTVDHKGILRNQNNHAMNSNFTFAQLAWLELRTNNNLTEVPDFFNHPDFVDGLYFSDLESIVSDDAGDTVTSRKCIKFVDMILSNLGEHSPETTHRLMLVGAAKTQKSTFPPMFAINLANNGIPLTEKNLTSLGYIGTSSKLASQYSSQLLKRVKDELGNNALNDPSCISHLLCIIQVSLTPHSAEVASQGLKEVADKAVDILATFVINEQGELLDSAVDILSKHSDMLRYPLAIKAIEESVLKKNNNSKIELIDVSDDASVVYQPIMY